MGIIYKRGGKTRSAMGGMRAPTGSGMPTPGVPSFNNEYRAPAMQGMPQVNPGITPAFQGGSTAPPPSGGGFRTPQDLSGEGAAPDRVTNPDFRTVYPVVQGNNEAYQKMLYNTQFNWDGKRTNLTDLYSQFGGEMGNDGSYNWDGTARVGMTNYLKENKNPMDTDVYLRQMVDRAKGTLKSYATNNTWPTGMDYSYANSLLGYEDPQQPVRQPGEVAPAQQISQRKGGKFKKPLFH